MEPPGPVTPGSVATVRVHRGTQFPLVQSLRGIAALWVVLFHASEGGHLPYLLIALPRWLGEVLFHWGHLGVPIFFALSGFVIAHSLREVDLSWNSFGRFALRRMIRLNPPYWASIVVVLVLGYFSAMVQREVFILPDVGTIAAHVVYLQTILGLREINTVYWTLTYEMQFYIVFGGASVLFVQKRAWAAALWTTLFALAMANALGGFEGMRPGLFLNCWAAFFAGVTAYKGIDDRWGLAASLILLAAMIASRDSFMLASAATAALLLTTSRTGIAQRPSISPVGPWIGMISYSLYLIHNPVTGATAWLAHQALGWSLLADLGVLVLIVAVTLGTAWGFWWLIERPAHQWSKRVSLKAS